MARFKQSFAGGSIRYKAESEYMISPYELNKLKAKPFDNLLKVENTKTGELIFKCPTGRTLAQELLEGIDETRLAQIVRQVLQLADQLQHIGLTIRRAVLSPEYIYVDSKEHNLKFIYLPVNGELLGYDELLFVKDVILQTKLGGSARIRWDEWAERLQVGRDYSAFIKTMPIDKREHKTVYINDEAPTAIEEEQKFVNTFESKNEYIENNMDDDGEAPTGLDDGAAIESWDFSSDDSPTSLEKDNGISEYAHPCGWDSEEVPTGIADEDMIDAMHETDGTFSESASESESMAAVASLVSVKNGERVVINQNTFRIGRSPQRADYCIANTSVSNVHAIILRMADGFYLKDNFSTNKTFVNGLKVNPQADPVKLSNGSIIRFWNLEYRFIIS